jgi:hypothetical protein
VCSHAGGELGSDVKGRALVVDVVSPGQAQDRSRRWRLVHTAGLSLLVALIAAVCLFFPRLASGGDSFGIWRLATWLLIMVLLGALFVLIGRGIMGLWKGCLIDNRNRISLSRLQLICWTVLVLSAFLTFAAFKVHAAPDADALDIVVPAQVWSLLGISTASLAGSATIKYAKRNTSVDQAVVQEEMQKTQNAITSSAPEAPPLEAQGLLANKETPESASISDLFTGDEIGSAAQLDVGKVQMFFFTLIVILAYAIVLGTILYRAGGLPGGLPDVSEGMVVLLLISHAGFLAGKAVPASPTRATTG